MYCLLSTNQDVVCIVYCRQIRTLFVLFIVDKSRRCLYCLLSTNQDVVVLFIVDKSRRCLYCLLSTNQDVVCTVYCRQNRKLFVLFIADLSAWVKDSLSKPKCPLYTIYVDFTKAFDSIDRSRLFAKLNDMGVSATFIKALWPIFKQNNFQEFCQTNL